MSARKMLFPYSLRDKIALFPYKHFWDNNWEFKYLIIATVLLTPVFYKIQKLSYSPKNVQRFEEIKRKEQKEYEEHLRHLK